jgi:hypothetical protein
MKEREKEICSLLEKKLSLFQSYLSVTKRMKRAFVDEEKGTHEVFLAERQGLIDKIEKIDSSMEKVIKGGEPQAGFGSDKETIETRLQEIKTLMETVKPMDEEMIAMVRGEEEQAKRSLLKMRGTRQAISGYQRMGKSPPKFFDTLR